MTLKKYLIRITFKSGTNRYRTVKAMSSNEALGEIFSEFNYSDDIKNMQIIAKKEIKS